MLVYQGESVSLSVSVTLLGRMAALAGCGLLLEAE